MTTRFDPDPKAYNPQANGQGNNYLNNEQLNNFDTYGNSQDYPAPIPVELVRRETKSQRKILPTSSKMSHKSGVRWWQRLRLTQKATVIAIALGTIPVLLTGVTAYKFANQSITRQVSQTETFYAIDMADKVKRFMRDRYGDIQVLANLPILTNPALNEATSLAEKQAVLDSYIEAFNLYDNIAVFDLQGELIAKSQGEAKGNHSDREYFRAVIRTNQPFISNPMISQSSGETSIYFAAPVKDQSTGETIAVIRSRLPVKSIEELIQNFGSDGKEYYLIDASSEQIFVAKETNKLNQDPTAVFPDLAQLRTAGKPSTLITTNQVNKHQDLLAYTPLGNLDGLPELKWEVAIAKPTAIAFEAQRQLILAFTLGTGLTVLLVSAIAAYLARRGTRPLLAATDVIKQLGRGELDARLNVVGEDEVAVLGSNINRMADKLGILLEEQQAYVEQMRLYSDLAVYSATEEDQAYIFNRAVEGAKKKLGADRVVVYAFEPDFSGTIIAEAVEPGWPLAFSYQISDPCISQELIEEYKKGRVVPNNDIRETNYSAEHIRLLEQLSVKANLVVPIVSGEDLLGLLIAHQCSNTRVWQQPEIDFLRNLAAQVGLSLTNLRFIDQKEAEANRAQKLNEIISRIRESFQVEEIYNAALAGVRATLKTDRAIVYLFDDSWQGSIVAESVGRGWPKSLGANIADPCFAEKYIEKYQKGLVSTNDNIYEAGLNRCYLNQLEPFEVKANLVAPILAYGKLHGLLVTHQCSAPRPWQDSEITFFKQVAIQVGSALDQAHLLEQQQAARQAAEAAFAEQRRQKEALQLQLLELLDDVEGAARGDLTVRADVTVGEIGTVADFFNSIIESLREIVMRVKQSAVQVNAAIGEDEAAIHQLSEEALKQVEETTRTLDSVQRMTLSIQKVAQSAHQAAAVASTASSTAEAGQATMDLTVQNILSLRTMVAETAKKVKRLGESSQQISKVVSLINKIALQTNLLAINAGIEAARAGEEGQGFAVVAEEVGELAEKSAAATKEIEQIVESIQLETAQVVEAMEQSTTQVVEGTHLVEQTKQSLGQILDVSRQIDLLVQSISEATVSQIQTSEEVSSLMHEIANASTRTSDSSSKVSFSLKRTAEIARELQDSVGTFNVDTEA